MTGISRPIYRNLVFFPNLVCKTKYLVLLKSNLVFSFKDCVIMLRFVLQRSLLSCSINFFVPFYKFIHTLLFHTHQNNVLITCSHHPWERSFHMILTWLIMIASTTVSLTTHIFPIQHIYSSTIGHVHDSDYITIGLLFLQHSAITFSPFSVVRFN